MRTLSEHACHGGTQGFHEHVSEAVGLPMRFGVFVPPQAKTGPVPVVFFLAGLTCNEETFAIKAGAQRHAAEHGLLLVTPDTSPRDTGVDGADAAWDFGTGAGFYLDATEAPWAPHWRMERYITDELPKALFSQFKELDGSRVSITGHSMGGHGALTLFLKNPGMYKSVSAFAPISNPSNCPWGQKAFGGYFGEDKKEQWAAHDATELLPKFPNATDILIDVGTGDNFYKQGQLLPEKLEEAAKKADKGVKVRYQDGYDHSYFFISTFAGDHVEHAAKYLTK